MSITDTFVQKQKGLLEKEKEKLEKKMSELEKYPDYGRGDDDNAREYEDFENNLSMEKQLQVLDKKVKSALKAIEKGTYGQCSICKSEIKKSRLQSMPYADICVTCQKTRSK